METTKMLQDILMSVVAGLVISFATALINVLRKKDH